MIIPYSWRIPGLSALNLSRICEHAILAGRDSKRGTTGPDDARSTGAGTKSARKRRIRQRGRRRVRVQTPETLLGALPSQLTQRGGRIYIPGWGCRCWFASSFCSRAARLPPHACRLVATWLKTAVCTRAPDSQLSARLFVSLLWSQRKNGNKFSSEKKDGVGFDP